MMLPRIGVSTLAFNVLIHAAAAAQSAASPLQYLSKECSEDAIRVQLDPRPFQDVVAAPLHLAVVDGKVTVLILGQDCPEYWLDGEALGPSQEIHVWVAVEGPNDLRPVVGAEQTRPTMTWFSLFDGNTNPRVRNAKLPSGSPQSAIDSVRLDPPRPDRGGAIVIAGNLRYSWHVRSAAPPVRLMGVNHDVHALNSAGGIVLNRIQALVHVTAIASPGTLEVTGSTAALPLIQGGTYQVSVNTFAPVWVRGTLGLSPPR